MPTWQRLSLSFLCFGDIVLNPNNFCEPCRPLTRGEALDMCLQCWIHPSTWMGGDSVQKSPAWSMQGSDSKVVFSVSLGSGKAAYHSCVISSLFLGQGSRMPQTLAETVSSVLRISPGKTAWVQQAHREISAKGQLNVNENQQLAFAGQDGDFMG